MSDLHLSGENTIGYNAQGNLFKDIHTRGIWSINSNLAMRLRCNLWTSPNTVCSNFICWSNVGIVPAQQGFSGGNTTLKAGNEWNLADYQNYVGVNSSTPYTYYSHAYSLAYPSVVPQASNFIVDINGVVKTSSSCVPSPLRMEDALIKLDSINLLLDSLEIIKSDLSFDKSAGLTDTIINYINGETLTDDQLADTLISYSPLSEIILDRFINSERHLSDSIFTSVMKYNLPISNDIFDSFKAKIKSFEDADLADSLMVLYGENPGILTPFGISREIESTILDKNEAVDFVMENYIEQDSIAQLIDFLFNQDSLNYKMEAVSTALEIDSLELARTMLNDLILTSTKELYWKEITEILLNLKDSGLTVFSMDSTMLANVIEIGTSGIECIATRNAQCILKLVYGIDFNEGEFGESRMASSGNSIKLPSKTSRLNNSITVSPNPTDQNLFVNLPNSLNFNQYKVFDINGKLVNFVNISPNSKNLVISTENLLNGIYQLVFINKNEIKTAKFVVQH